MQAVTALDTDVLWWIQDHLASPLMDIVMPAVTRLGDAGAIWLIIGLILLLRKTTRIWGITMLASLVLCFVGGNLLLKPLIARLRPCHIQELPLLIAVPSDFSFPSGHTMTSFAAAAVLHFYHKTWGKAALILATLIAFSRLYLLVHYPSDVAAGLALGLVMAWLARLVVEVLFPQKGTL